MRRVSRAVARIFSDGDVASRQRLDRILLITSLFALLVPIVALVLLLGDVIGDALPRLSWAFVTGYPSRHAASAGVLPAIVGTVCLMLLTAALALPIGLGAAIYLEEYAGQTWYARVIEVNIANLAGVPSIIYGLLGLELFVRNMNMGRSLLAGAATLALLLLPMVIMTAREALRAVPASVREAAYALGSGKWHTLRRIVLPMCFPGLLTGVILSMARAIGETAPLITIGALTYVAFLPDSVHSPFTALPIQVFNWVSRPEGDFKSNAAAGIVILLAVMLLMNAIAIRLRMRLQQRINW